MRSLRGFRLVGRTKAYLVTVQRPPRLSRSMHIGDVSEMSKTRSNHVTRYALAARNNEA